MGYRVTVIRDEAALLQLEKPWTELLIKCGTATVFSSFQWNIAWWHHFGAGSALYVITVWENPDRLIAVAPLMLRRLGPVRKLEFLGTGLSDQGEVLLSPECRRQASAAIFSYLQAKHRHWDLCDWSEIPASSQLLASIRERKPGGLRLAVTPQTPVPVIDLPDTWDAYVNGLARKRRYYVSSYPRKFLRDHDAGLQVTTGGQDVKKAVDTFYRLHMASWAGREEELSLEHRHPGFLPFLREACERCAARGWLRILSLRVGEQVPAAAINFMLQGRWSGYMKGADPQWSASRPGTVLDALRIKGAISEGAKLFDFGRGAEPYKTGFGVRIEMNSRILLAPRTPRSLAAFTLLTWRIQRAQRNTSMTNDE